VQPNDSYRSRLRSKFSVPPPRPSAPLCNPCVSHSKTIKKSSDMKVVKGKVRTNPFVEPNDQIALN
jgi:hypothetical protein